jgi:phosphatidylserine/phosphatidylglycerophosphate/cardiolipin synthase-like enzyme
MKRLRFPALAVLALWCLPALAQPAPAPEPDTNVTPMAAPAKISVCFTPDHPCSPVLLQQIKAAQKEILVHAHNFTNRSIVKALIEAKRRGVDVRVIMNARHERDQTYAFRTLVEAGVPVFIDRKARVAHNKVMIFDRRAVTTGSYNLTRAADKRNAENLVLIQDSPVTVNAYVANWERRLTVSTEGKLAPKAANDNDPGDDDDDDK